MAADYSLELRQVRGDEAIQSGKRTNGKPANSNNVVSANQF